MNTYLESNQLENDLMILERQLARLTQDVRHINSQLENLIVAIKAAKGSQRR